MLRVYLGCALLLGLASGAWAQAPLKEAPQKAAAVLTGRLVHQHGAPLLKVRDKAYRLVSADEYANTILNEKRVTGWELQLEGRWKASDTFQVDRVFSIRDGKLYKVTYFCQVCNITSYRPGLCDCCQDPTEVREVPLQPQGIY